MPSRIHPRRPLLLRILAVAVAAVVLNTTVLAQVAEAHGSTIDPASRNYGCWKRWGSDFQNPTMATVDPMCWQAWQADSSAMWNWNGLYREGVAGNHQGAIPDGQLCSGGRTGGMRYAALDTVGAWQATQVNNNFSLTVHDQARHGADYFRIYVTKQGFNPLTTALKWSDLELRTTTGVYAPGAGQTTTDPVLNGVSNTISVSAPNRTGRHIVYTVWQASHSDQSYYWCSDVIFPGGSNPTTPPTTTPPTSNPTTRPPTTPPTTVPPTTRPPTTAPPSGTRACTAVYSVVQQWPGGYTGEVRVTAGSTAISSWRVGWTFANGQQVTNAWSATVTTSGTSVSAVNVGYNGSLAAGGSTAFGFNGSWIGSNAVPAVTCTAT